MSNWAYYLSEPREKLLPQLTIYFLIVGVVIIWAPTLVPVETVDEIITATNVGTRSPANEPRSLSDFLANDAHPDWTADLSWVALVWSTLTVFLFCVPMTWVYRGTRRSETTLQSIVETMIVLPVVTVGIIMMVHDSLALAFSLGGIFAGVQFRSRLREIADTHYVFAAIGLGLACGIGVIEFAFVMSICFCYVVYGLWHVEYASEAATRHSRRRRRNNQNESLPEAIAATAAHERLRPEFSGTVDPPEEGAQTLPPDPPPNKTPE